MSVHLHIRDFVSILWIKYTGVGTREYSRCFIRIAKSSHLSFIFTPLNSCNSLPGTGYFSILFAIVKFSVIFIWQTKSCLNDHTHFLNLIIRKRHRFCGHIVEVPPFTFVCLKSYGFHYFFQIFSVSSADFRMTGIV